MIVLPSDNLGGAEQFLFNLARYYVIKGNQVDVFFLYHEKSKKWRDIPGANLRFTNSNSEIKGIYPMICNIKKNGSKKYDIIFSSHQHINCLLSILIKFQIIKTRKFICRESTSIFLRYSGLKLFYHKFLYALYQRNIDLIICQTEEMKNQLLLGMKKFSNFCVKVIKNPIDVTEIKSRSEEALPFELPEKFVLAIGRLNHVKRFDKLIHAYNKSQLKRNYSLLILGAGNEYANLTNLIKGLDLEQDVILKGHVDNVFPIIKKASLGIISSEIEGFPNVLIQMYALNLKVVTTNCCGGLNEFPDLYVCKDNSVEELSFLCDLAIKENLKIDFTNFVERFDINSFIHQIEKNYE
jgi:glycosyltransferase involved in cell wall biosynthesis